MPCSVLWESTGVTWKFYGYVTCDDIVAVGADLLQDKRFDSLNYRICDFTDVEKLDISSDDALRISQYDIAASKRNPNIRSAIVAVDTQIRRSSYYYIIGKQASSWRVKLFENLMDARAWAWLELED